MDQLMTFDQLPLAVSLLAQKLDNIERLLSERSEHTTQHPDQLLTIEQAAEYLSLAVPTIYSMVSRKQLPYMKRSKRLYFSQIELNNYLKEGRNKTHEEIAQEAKEFIANRKGLNNGK